MATFYVGPRPVLRGQSTADMVNPYYTMTGKAKGTGTYSYYPLYSTSQILTGAPDNNHTPGAGRHPGNVFLSQLFNGSTLYAGTTPLAGTFPNGSATYDGARFQPQQFKGLDSAKALNGGHAVDRANDYALYSNYQFDGVTSAEAFSGTGHAKRVTAYSLYNSYIFDGVTSANVFTANYGQANATSDYGRAKNQEWKGVASAKAL
mgnify:CR=1 FL=1|jgi:hypothetical protein